jgi:hypothetical protein
VRNESAEYCEDDEPRPGIPVLKTVVQIHDCHRSG